MAGKTTRVDVAYAITRPGYAPATTTVALEDGRNTVADIPQIIATRRGVAPAEVQIIATQELDD